MRQGFPGGSMVKNSPLNARDAGWIPRTGKIPWRRKWQPLQYSYLRNPKDRGAWYAVTHGVTKSQHNLATKNNNSAMRHTVYLFSGCVCMN